MVYNKCTSRSILVVHLLRLPFARWNFRTFVPKWTTDRVQNNLLGLSLWETFYYKNMMRLTDSENQRERKIRWEKKKKNTGKHRSASQSHCFLFPAHPHDRADTRSKLGGSVKAPLRAEVHTHNRKAQLCVCTDIPPRRVLVSLLLWGEKAAGYRPPVTAEAENGRGSESAARAVTQVKAPQWAERVWRPQVEASSPTCSRKSETLDQRLYKSFGLTPTHSLPPPLHCDFLKPFRDKATSASDGRCNNELLWLIYESLSGLRSAAPSDRAAVTLRPEDPSVRRCLVPFPGWLNPTPSAFSFLCCFCWLCATGPVV